MSLVGAKVQGEKRKCLSIIQKQVVYTPTKCIFAHTKNITYSVFHFLVMARNVFLKSQCLALPNNEMEMLRRSNLTHICLWCASKAHVKFSHISRNSNTSRPPRF